jgi:hypothetical protein
MMPAIDSPASAAMVARDRGRGAESGESADVTGTGGVVDDADDHEQCRLEHRVRDQHVHAGQRHVLIADADQDHQESELGDRAVGEDQLQVALAHRSPAAEQHRHAAEADHRDLPGDQGRRTPGPAGRRGRCRPFTIAAACR